MVQKVCAGVGGGLSVVSLILMIVASLDQRFVTVSLPGVDECEGTDDVSPLGTVGIFKSTFDPACAQQFGPPAVASGYALFSKAETPTTEFWPLFPAQQGIGGATGLTSDDFTTCEEFYSPTGPFEASASAFGVGFVFSGLGAQLAEQYQTFSTTVQLVFGGVGGALPSLILSSWGEGTIGALGLLSANFDLPSKGGAAVLTILAAHLQEEGCAFGAPALGAPTTSCTTSLTDVSLDGNNVFDILNPAEAVTFSASYIGPFAMALGALTGASGGAPVFLDLTAAQTAFGLLTGAEQLATVADVQATLADLAPIILLNAAPFLGTQPVPSADLAGFAGLVPAFFNGLVATGANATLAADFDFTSIKSIIATLDAGSRAEGSDALAPVTALFDVCINGTTVNECLTFENGLDTSVPSLGDPTPNNYCILASQEEPFASLLNETRADDCTILALLSAFGGLTAEEVLALLPEEITSSPAAAGIVDLIGPALPALVQAIQLCAAFPPGVGLTLEQCAGELVAPTGDLTQEEQGTIPANFTQGKYALCGGLPLIYGLATVPCAATQTFEEFTTATAATLAQVAGIAGATAAADPTADNVAAAEAALESATSAGAAAAVVSTCVALGATNADACIVALAGLNVAAPNNLTSGLVATVAGNLNLAETVEERIAACNDDEEDLKAFTTAQTMLPPAMALIGLGGIMGIVAAIVNKAPVAFVGGALSVLGAGLVMGALLIVQGAPVYASVGGDPVDFTPLYSADVAQVFALAAIGTGIVGGIVTLVSGCLNKGESETAVSGKVEASY